MYELRNVCCPIICLFVLIPPTDMQSGLTVKDINKETLQAQIKKIASQKMDVCDKKN